MTPQIIAALICASPLLMLAFGYYIGRYGSPIVIKRQPRRDRRAVSSIAADGDALEDPDDFAAVYN